MKFWKKNQVPKIYPEYVFTGHSSLEEHKDIEHFSKQTNHRDSICVIKPISVNSINIVMPKVKDDANTNTDTQSKSNNWVLSFMNGFV